MPKVDGLEAPRRPKADKAKNKAGNDKDMAIPDEARDIALERNFYPG